MAVKKKLNDFGVYSLPNSGKIFLNEHTILKNNDSQKTKNYYVPITGDVIDTVSIQFYNSHFDDKLSIDFDKNNIDNTSINISTGLTDNLKNLLNSSGYLKLNNIIATPSEISNLTIIPDKINDFEKINKIIGLDQKHVASRRNYFNPAFNDNKNYDFSNLNKYNFLENDYEYTSIDIELNNPVDVILQHTAKIQTNDQNYNYEGFSINFDEQDKDIYYSFDFDNTKIYDRLNTPFVIYNTRYECFEYRGLIQPHTQFSELFNTIGNEFVPTDIYDNIINTLPFIDNTDDLSQIETLFNQFFQKYLIQQDCLTNTPINFLKNTQQHFAESYLSEPSSQFGFPFADKFKLLDENVLKLSKYINKSFILDKISLSLDVDVLGEISNIQSGPITSDINISNELFNSLNFGIIARKNRNLNDGLESLTRYNQSKSFNKLKFENGAPLGYPLYNLTNFGYELQYQESNYIFKTLANNEYNLNNLKNNLELNIPSDDSSIVLNKKYNNELITYGNIMFRSIIGNEHRDENYLKNNCDYYIKFNPQNINNIYDQIYTTCNYSGNVNFTTFTRKKGFSNRSLNMHNLNYQLPLPTYTGDIYLDYSRRKNSINTYSNNLFNQQYSFATQNIFINNPDAFDPDYDKLFGVNYQLIRYIAPFKNDNYVEYSPYILSPDDEISFYFSISPTISPILLKQLIKLKKGKIRFTLHGYIPKNNEKNNDLQSLKNLNQENLNSNMLGSNSFITNNYSNLLPLSKYINTYNDRNFTGNFQDGDRTSDYSKILSGFSYIPYVKMDENRFDYQYYNYDNFKLDFYSNNEIYYTNYTDDSEDGQAQFKNGLYQISYSKEFDLYYEYKSKTVDQCFYLQNKYGMYSDFVQQRKFTTTFDNDNNVYYVVEQNFIDENTGNEIINLSDSRLSSMYNKSKSLQLINAKGQIFSYNDIKLLKHVAFNDSVI